MGEPLAFLYLQGQWLELRVLTVTASRHLGLSLVSPSYSLGELFPLRSETRKGLGTV